MCLVNRYIVHDIGPIFQAVFCELMRSFECGMVYSRICADGMSERWWGWLLVEFIGISSRSRWRRELARRGDFVSMCKVRDEYSQEVKGRRTEVEQDTADDCELDGLLGLDFAGLFCSGLSVFRVWYDGLSEVFACLQRASMRRADWEVLDRWGKSTLISSLDSCCSVRKWWVSDCSMRRLWR